MNALEIISQMTLEEKIGQLVIAGAKGFSYNDDFDTLIKKYKLGNINILSSNFRTLKELHDLCMRLHQEIISTSKVPCLLSITQEGGNVTRIFSEATFFPGSMTLGALKEDYTYEVARLLASELIMLGIGLNFAPSLDINSNPRNPIIGARSYSSDANIVAERGLNFIKGMKIEGVMSVAKHFLGHGSTFLDSHLNLPTVDLSLEELESREVIPFKKVLDEVGAIMPAHIIYKALDDVPGTISKKVIKDYLLDKLNFKGLVISDCLEMKAISGSFNTASASVEALNAGVDMLIVSSNLKTQIEVLEELKKAVLENRLDIKKIDKKLEKIINMKISINEVLKNKCFNKTYSEKEKVLKDVKRKEFVQSIVDQSLTLVKGERYYPSLNTLVICLEDKKTRLSLFDYLNQEEKNYSLINAPLDLTSDEIKELVKVAKRYEQVVVFTFDAFRHTSQIQLVNYLNNEVYKLFGFSLKSPNDYCLFKHLKNYLCLYEYTPNSFKTVSKFLNGEIKAFKNERVEKTLNLVAPVEVGASVYVGLDEYPLEKNLEYLELLKEKKIEKVFISAHIPEMKEGFYQELEAVCKKASLLGLKIIMDVAKPMMKNFKMVDVYALRLDYGFSVDDILEMNKNEKFLLEFNASTISIEKLEELKEKGLDFSKVRISHNFYPKKYTGLSREEVLKRNEIFKSYGLRVMLYIPSNNQKRPPMYEGLPTIEEHRYEYLEAILSEMRYLKVDEVFIGDSYASKEELDIIKNFDFSVAIIPIIVDENITIEELEQLNLLHHNRMDEPIYFKRSSVRSKNVILPRNQIDRKVGFITIDNSLFKRYQGEVCILMQDLEKDERVNVVAKVASSINTVSFIKKGESFRFKIVGKEPIKC